MQLQLIAGIILTLYAIRGVLRSLLKFRIFSLMIAMVALYLGYLLITNGETRDLGDSLVDFVNLIKSVAMFIYNLFT